MGNALKTKLSSFLKDWKSSQKIKKVIHNQRSNGKIRVAFIVQMPEIWDKESPVYEEMLKDDLFDPTLIVIPPYDQEQDKVQLSFEHNYFLENYPEAIRGYDSKQWINLKERKYDYVFLQRPYDHYLPEGFRGTDIVEYSKVCYIPYGFSSADVFNGGNTDKTFFRNVYMSFLESEYMTNLLNNQFRYWFEKKSHKVFNLGYPALSPYLSFPQANQIRSVLWTPRWSFDPIIGGSNFMKYKESFLSLTDSHPECTFIFRPHPLMFGEILRQGLMTQEEINDYLNLLQKKHVVYDHGTPLLDTFLKTDLLITDFSSIIIQFFLTNRPLIYCPSDIVLNDTLEKVKQGMYVANSQEELISFVEILLKNNDPLREKRLSIIDDDDFKCHSDAAKKILEAIKLDFE